MCPTVGWALVVIYRHCVGLCVRCHVVSKTLELKLNGCRNAWSGHSYDGTAS